MDGRSDEEPVWVLSKHLPEFENRDRYGTSEYPEN